MKASEIEVKIGKIDAMLQTEIPDERRESLWREKEQLEAELSALKVEQDMKAEIVESAFSLVIGGKDVTEGMDDRLKELLELVYDEATAKAQQKHEIELATYRAEVETWKREVEEKEQANLSLSNQLSDLNARLVSETEENQGWRARALDAEQKRDAAAAELEEARKEIERLKDQIEEYQKAKVFGEKEAQKIVEIKATERAEKFQELIRQVKILAPIGPMYTEVVDAHGNREVVPNSELEKLPVVDEFTPPAIPDPTEIPEAEDEREETFPESADHPSTVVPESAETDDRGMAEEYDTKAEIEALKRRVERLEVQANIRVA